MTILDFAFRVRFFGHTALIEQLDWFVGLCCVVGFDWFLGARCFSL
jgi:hypothetical protein